jgi:hypothetical protein
MVSFWEKVGCDPHPFRSSSGKTRTKGMGSAACGMMSLRILFTEQTFQGLNATALTLSSAGGIVPPEESRNDRFAALWRYCYVTMVVGPVGAKPDFWFIYNLCKNGGLSFVARAFLGPSKLKDCVPHQCLESS